MVFHVLPMRPAYQSQINRPDEFYGFRLAFLVRSVKNFTPRKVTYPTQLYGAAIPLNEIRLIKTSICISGNPVFSWNRTVRSC